MKIVASSDSLRWSEIKRALKAKLRENLEQYSIQYSKNLVNQCFPEKVNEGYIVTDLILKHL
ncbi:MAG: hypothetical protein N3F64_07460 [Nitrososphaeria archaeon]|nr:hypothetical protein [Nitrososphaeria archaeon]